MGMDMAGGSFLTAHLFYLRNPLSMMDGEHFKHCFFPLHERATYFWWVGGMVNKRKLWKYRKNCEFTNLLLLLFSFSLFIFFSSFLLSFSYFHLPISLFYNLLHYLLALILLPLQIATETHKATFHKGRIELEVLCQSKNIQKYVFPEKNYSSADITCFGLTSDFLVFANKNGSLFYFALRGGENPLPVTKYCHANCGILRYIFIIMMFLLRRCELRKNLRILQCILRLCCGKKPISKQDEIFYCTCWF